jgi:hypothetical protein
VTGRLRCGGPGRAWRCYGKGEWWQVLIEERMLMALDSEMRRKRLDKPFAYD